MGSYYSRAKTFAENVLEQTMSFTKGKKRVATMMPIGVPRVPYKTPGENMWQWVDIWNQLVATMLFLDNLDSTKPMYLYINTEGGQVVPTMAIMDTMNHAKSKVGTVAFGSARAMGGLLLTNGEKGMRAALPNTCVMLHHPSGVARGAASDVQNEGRELLNIREKINKVVAKNCNQDIELVRKTINRDKHFTAEQAQDWGIIDKVLYRTRK
jgi:ATP-dependent Clp protease, protease subunit